MPFATVGNPPVDLYYHVHGAGPQRVLFINGLGGIAHHWDIVAEDLVRDGEFSACVFDNRGVGLSSVPRGPYTTRLMAQDACALLAHLGWDRVHVVGISLGGMIAQELAIILGDRILSLTLESTYCRFSGIPLQMLKLVLFGNGVVSNDVRQHSQFIPTVLFPPEWLAAPSKSNPEITNHEFIAEYMHARASKTGLQKPAGRIAQQHAGGFHYCHRRLDVIRDAGYPILVIAGDKDNILVQPSSSEYLARRLNARLEIYRNGGHIVYMQDPHWHNSILREHLRGAVNKTVDAATEK